MIVQEIFAQIHEGIVKNICQCDDSYKADFVTKCTYGEDAFAVQCNQYGCRIGDSYRDGTFYHIDEETGEEKEVYYSPTAEEEVVVIKGETQALKDDQDKLLETYLDYEFRLSNMELMTANLNL